MFSVLKMQHTQGNQYKRKQIWDVLTILDSSFDIFAILLFAPFCGAVSETPVGIIRCASSWRMTMRTGNWVMLFLCGKCWVLLWQKQKLYLITEVLMTDHLPWVPGLETSQCKVISSQSLCAANIKEGTCFVYRWTSVWWDGKGTKLLSGLENFKGCVYNWYLPLFW